MNKRAATFSFRSVTRIATAACVMVPTVALPQTSNQPDPQSGFYIVPSISVARVHDDNLFFTANDEIDDEITRISPALEIGYDTARLNWRGSYIVDSESYRDNDYLDDHLTRRLGQFSAQYLASPRLTLALDSSFTNTETPADLTLFTGVPTGRFEAERLVVNPSVSYRFTAATTGIFELIHTEDELEEMAASSQISTLATRFEHRYSPENMLTFGYQYREFEFEGGLDQDTHIPWIGWVRNFSPRTTFIAEAGPRITEDSTDAYLLLSVQHQYEQGIAEISYTIDETNSIGDIGRVENRTLLGTLSHRIGENFTLAVSASYGEVEYYDLTSDIYRVGVDLNYQVFNSLQVFARYSRNVQRAGFLEADNREISRSVASIGFTLSYPR